MTALSRDRAEGDRPPTITSGREVGRTILLQLDDAMGLHGHQHAIDRGRGFLERLGQPRQCGPFQSRQFGQHDQGAVQRLDGVLFGLVVEGAGTAAGAASGIVRSGHQKILVMAKSASAM